MGVATSVITLQFSSITFTVWGDVRFPLLLSDLQSFEFAMEDSHPSLYQDFHPRSHPSLVVKPGITCKFLIHSGSLQKMLTALFNLVWNTQKSKWTILFECQGKMFLRIEKVLEKISEEQPYMHCIIVFLHIFEIKVSHFY